MSYLVPAVIFAAIIAIAGWLWAKAIERQLRERLFVVGRDVQAPLPRARVRK